MNSPDLSPVRRTSGRSGCLLLALSLLTGIAFTAVPSTAKVLDRCRKSMPGQALRQLRNLRLSGLVQPESGAPGRFTLWFARPDRFRLDLDLQGKVFSECYNGKSAWREDGPEVSSLISGEADQLQLAALLGNYRWTEPKNTPLALKAKAVVVTSGEKEQWCANMSLREAGAKISVDPKNGRLEDWAVLDADGRVSRRAFDHRRAGGLWIPHRFAIRSGSTDVQLEVTAFEVDGPEPADLFEYPRADAGQAPPDLPALFSAIQQNQAEVERRREQFTCRKTEQTFERGKDGRETVKETKVFDVTPVGSQFVDRLISVDGKPLSPKEQAKEDKRVEKEIRELLQKKKKNGEIRISASDFLRISKISSPRQERYRGHDVFVFDFEPRPGYKPRNREEEIVSRLAGHMWVDAAEKQIVRLAAHFTEKYSVGLGLLASISPSTAIVIQQEKINDEVWMPAHLELNLSGRALFFKLNLRQVLRYSDYQRVGVSVDYHLPPS